MEKRGKTFTKNTIMLLFCSIWSNVFHLAPFKCCDLLTTKSTNYTNIQHWTHKIWYSRDTILILHRLAVVSRLKDFKWAVHIKLHYFRYCFSFAILLAANFGCYHFRIMPEIVFKLLGTTLWIGCAVTIGICQWAETMAPLFWTVVDVGLLLCTRYHWEHVDLPYAFFFLKNQWMMGRLSLVKKAALVYTKF